MTKDGRLCVGLGVTGGIAAYKACDITSALAKEDLCVNVILTEHAQEFVTPLPFQSLSGQPVITDMFAPLESFDIEHIALAKKADVFLIAPATANFIAKMAAGIADDMLSTVLLATRAQILIAPAMNTMMWEHPITKQNIQKLKDLGYHFIEPQSGRLACRDIGKGKLAAVEDILESVRFALYRNDRFFGKKIVVTAGPTVEDLDDVRFLSNRSSGKMGYAIAAECALRGAKVCLISGPSDLKVPYGVQTVRKVRSAQQMHQAVLEEFGTADAVIQSAAVADYTPTHKVTGKIKKQPGAWNLSLERTIDIAKELGEKKDRQILIGFAAEASHLEANAIAKLKAKGLDLIAANDILAPGSGFSGDTNQLSFYTAQGKVHQTGLVKKREAAQMLCDQLEILFSQNPA